MDSNYYKKLLIHNNVDINENINNENVTVRGVYKFTYKEVSIRATYKDKAFIVRKKFAPNNVKYPLYCLNGCINIMYKEIVRLIEERYSLNYDFEK